MNKENLWVMVFEHDIAAARGMRMLGLRDCRVASCEVITDPIDLIAAATKANPPIDLIYVDCEYDQTRIPLASLLRQLRTAQPKARVVCLINIPAADILYDAVSGGAHGLLVKNEISLGLIHAGYYCEDGLFLYTDKAQPYLPPQQVAGRMRYTRVPGWQPHPDLARHAHEVFYAAVVDGVSNKLIARRLDRSVSAIEKCIGRCYDALIGTNFIDWRGIEGIDLDEYAKEEQAYLFYTGLPRQGRCRPAKDPVALPWSTSSSTTRLEKSGKRAAKFSSRC